MNKTEPDNSWFCQLYHPVLFFNENHYVKGGKTNEPRKRKRLPK